MDNQINSFLQTSNNKKINNHRNSINIGQVNNIKLKSRTEGLRWLRQMRRRASRQLGRHNGEGTRLTQCRPPKSADKRWTGHPLFLSSNVSSVNYCVWASVFEMHLVGEPKRKREIKPQGGEKKKKYIFCSCRNTARLWAAPRPVCRSVCGSLPSMILTKVLFFLAKEAEPLLPIFIFTVFVAHGHACGVDWAGRDGRDGGHGHGAAEDPRTSGRVSWSRWNGTEDGADPGAHFRLEVDKGNLESTNSQHKCNTLTKSLLFITSSFAWNKYSFPSPSLKAEHSRGQLTQKSHSISFYFFFFDQGFSRNPF